MHGSEHKAVRGASIGRFSNALRVYNVVVNVTCAGTGYFSPSSVTGVFTLSDARSFSEPTSKTFSEPTSDVKNSTIGFNVKF